MKRTRESESESENESEAERTPVTEEEVASVVMALLNARFNSRPIKGSTFSELAPTANRATLIERVNDMLAEGTMYEMVRIPERVTGQKKAAPRNEYTLRTRMAPDTRRVVLKYCHPGTIETESKMLHIVVLVLAGGEIPEPQLVKSLVDTGIADEAGAKALIARTLTQRLLEQHEDTVQGGKKLAVFTVGPAASVIFTKDALFDYLLDFMDYSEDTQTLEMLNRNKEILRRKIDAALGRF